MADYRLGPPPRFGGRGFVVRTADGTAIKADPTDPDFQAYLAWVAAGNVADPYVPPAPPTPDEIYDAALLTDRVLKAVVLAINDGSLVVGGNKTGAQLRAILKARM